MVNLSSSQKLNVAKNATSMDGDISFLECHSKYAGTKSEVDLGGVLSCRSGELGKSSAARSGGYNNFISYWDIWIQRSIGSMA